MRIAWFCALAALGTLAHARDAAPHEPPAFRLGDVATPLEYAVTLAVDPREARFSGEVRIAMRINRATSVLWLNATNLRIEAAQLQQGNVTMRAGVLAGGEDFIGLEARGPELTPGVAIATVRYNGAFEGLSTRGLFREDDRGEWYVLSQFESIHARRAFPCFDEPQWKTQWRLTIDAPAANVAVSNTPERRASPAPRREGWTRHEFAPTKPLPTYLVALAVGPFDVVDGGTAGAKKTKLRYLAPKGRAKEARYAKEATPRLLELLEAYFGMPYPFDKLDSVSLPQAVGFGAMENVGLITYASSILLATPREDIVPFRRRYASIAAHELAHMWFGNLVTLAWWDDTWLNEAFATWMSAKTMARFNPDWDNGWSVAYSRIASLELDRLASARRVRNPVLEKNDIFGAFDAITYNKGAAVLAMFEASLSPEAFRDGVRAYLKRYAWSSATSADFLRALGQASGRGDTLAAFRGFIEQPGVPMIDVALHCTAQSASVELIQRRLRPLGSQAEDEQWTTPACLRHDRTTRCADIHNGVQTLDLPEASSCPAWVLANAGGRAHYVPRYDGATGEKLRAGAGALSASEMVSALVDARILAESGLMSLAEALAWADAGLGHPSAVARVFALELLEKQREGWLSALEAAARRDILARRVRPLAAELGWEERDGESDDLRELRPRAMAFAATIDKTGALRDRARELAVAWLADRDAVPASTTRAVLGTAARFADEGTYGRLAGAIGTPDLRERHELVAALAKVRNPALRERALSLTLQDTVNGRDARDLLSEALQDDANRRAAFDFLRTNYDALMAKLPQHSMAWLMGPLGDLCTREERALFVDFWNDRSSALLAGPRQYRQALERIDLCLAAREHP